MHARILGLWLASLAIAPAQESVTADDLRALLSDPNSDLAKLAEQMAGKKGGNQLFYFPTRDEPATPAEWGLKFESIHFKSADNTALHGWFIPAKGKAAKSAKATVVFSHGNAGSIGHHLGFCAWLAEASYNVILYDYRGFGKSGGTPDRRGMIDDVKAAFAYARKRPDIDTSRLVSYGHSLGGAVAPLLATRLAGDPTSRLAMDKESRQEIYTFGAPQIGNVAAVKGVNNAGYDLHRINTLGDLVPGSTLKLGHGPAGRELASGSIMLDADPSRLERVRQAGNSSSSVQGVFTGPKDIAKVASEGHNMDTYISDIERSMENAWRFPSGNLNRNLRPAASDPTKVTTNGSLDTPSASSDGQRAVTSQSPGHTQQAIPDTVGSKEILDSGSASSAFAP